jgi:hypothetical protein
VLQPLATTTTGRVVGAGARVRTGSRTVSPSRSRWASLTPGWLWMRRASPRPYSIKPAAQEKKTEGVAATIRVRQIQSVPT